MPVLERVAKLDGRRPAAWIAAVAAVPAGWLLSVGGPPQGGCSAAAIASGGLLAVAAIGRVPSGLPAGCRRPALAVAGLRLIWPLAGLFAGAAAAAAGGGGAGWGGCGLAMVSAAAHAGLFALLLRSPRTQGAVASLTLAIAGGAAGAAAVVASGGGGPLLQTLTAFAAWVMLVAAASVPRAGGGPEWLGSVPPVDPHRSLELAPAVVMVTALAAMMFCFFLAPRFAPAYALLAVGWFTCLTVPPATAGGGDAATRRLVRAAAGRPPLPGSLRWTVSLTVRWVGILAWPALVAAVLPASDGQRSWGPLLALAGLGLAAAVLLLAAAAMAIGVVAGETARATLLSLVALATVGGTARNMPKSPSLPAAMPAPAAASAATGVEPWRRSCKTPQPTQPPGSSRPAPRFVEIRFPRAR